MVLNTIMENVKMLYNKHYVNYSCHFLSSCNDNVNTIILLIFSHIFMFELGTITYIGFYYMKANVVTIITRPYKIETGSATLRKCTDNRNQLKLSKHNGKFNEHNNTDKASFE